MEAAWDRVDEDFRETLRRRRTTSAASTRPQVHQGFVLTDRPGVVLGQRYTPIEKVGVCVPRQPGGLPLHHFDERDPRQDRRGAGDRGGDAAGRGRRHQRRRPWRRRRSPGRTGCSSWAAPRRWRPWPTARRRVPRVDKIVGPGGVFVAAAKRKVFGQVAIDMIAGPSEILVVADGKTQPRLGGGGPAEPGGARHPRRRRAGDGQPPSGGGRPDERWSVSWMDLPRRDIARKSLEANGKIMVTDRPGRGGGGRQPHRSGAPGAVRGRSLRPAAPGAQRRQRLSGPPARRRPWGTISPAPTTPCPPAARPGFPVPLSVDDFVKKSQLPLLHPGGAGMRPPPGSRTSRSGRASTATPNPP